MSEFHLEMEQLRADYRQSVAVDLQALRELAGLLRGDDQDRELLQQMAATLHRIAGGAGVFDLPRLSEQTRGLELDLSDWLAKPLGAEYHVALPELRANIERLATWTAA